MREEQIKIFGKFSIDCVIDAIKWLGVIALLVLMIISSYFYRNYSLFYQIVIDIFIVVIASYLAIVTNHGRLAVIFAKESYLEIRKVIWPTFRESLYITCIVLVVTIIMSLILWSLDGILVRIVSLGLRL